jgi:hypothetical protein
MSGTRPSGNFYTNFKNSKRSQNSHLGQKIRNDLTSAARPFGLHFLWPIPLNSSPSFLHGDPKLSKAPTSFVGSLPFACPHSVSTDVGAKNWPIFGFFPPSNNLCFSRWRWKFLKFVYSHWIRSFSLLIGCEMNWDWFWRIFGWRMLR